MRCTKAGSYISSTRYFFLYVLRVTMCFIARPLAWAVGAVFADIMMAVSAVADLPVWAVESHTSIRGNYLLKGPTITPIWTFTEKLTANSFEKKSTAPFSVHILAVMNVCVCSCVWRISGRMTLLIDVCMYSYRVVFTVSNHVPRLATPAATIINRGWLVGISLSASGRPVGRKVP